jgi:hypothetical protein
MLPKPRAPIYFVGWNYHDAGGGGATEAFVDA